MSRGIVVGYSMSYVPEEGSVITVQPRSKAGIEAAVPDGIVFKVTKVKDRLLTVSVAGWANGDGCRGLLPVHNSTKVGLPVYFYLSDFTFSRYEGDAVFLSVFFFTCK